MKSVTNFISFMKNISSNLHLRWKLAQFLFATLWKMSFSECIINLWQRSSLFKGPKREYNVLVHFKFCNLSLSFCSWGSERILSLIMLCRANKLLKTWECDRQLNEYQHSLYLHIKLQHSKVKQFSMMLISWTYDVMYCDSMNTILRLICLNYGNRYLQIELFANNISKKIDELTMIVFRFDWRMFEKS